MMNLKEITSKNNLHVQYPDVPSAIRPILDGQDFPVPDPHSNIDYSSNSDHSEMTVVAEFDV